MAESNGNKFEAMHRFLSKHQFEIDKNVPDKLICGKCRNLLVNPYQGSCLCKYCLSCINEMLRNRIDKCPGSKVECKDEKLAQFVTHHSSNCKISKLILKCPNELCQHECELVKMDDHLSLCSMNKSSCSVFSLRQNDVKLADSLPPNGFLMQTIGDLRNEMKQNAERNNEEIQRNKYQIKMLAEKARIKDSKITAIQEELQKNQNQLNILQMESKNKIADLREEMTKERWDHLNRHRATLDGGVENSQLQWTSRTAVEGKRQNQLMDSTFLWKVDNVLERRGKCLNIYSPIFYPRISPYKMQLIILNGAKRDQLDIQLCIHPSENDASLEWPFQGNVSMQIANKPQINASIIIRKYCDIPKPNNKSFKCSATFKFSYAGLSTAGLLEDNYFIIRCKVE